MKSYIEDTTDFLRKIDNIEKLPERYILGTLDVTALYTNIRNIEGISSISKILEQKRNKHEKPSNNTLIKLLEAVLTKNNFQFNGSNYLQMGGTAMGMKVAPSFANLFMSNLAEELLEIYPLKTESLVQIYR